MLVIEKERKGNKGNENMGKSQIGVLFMDLRIECNSEVTAYFTVPLWLQLWGMITGPANYRITANYSGD